MSGRRRKSPTVIKNVPGGYMLDCLGCGASADVKPPMEAWRFMAILRGFADEHQECVKRPAEAEQVKR